MKRTVRDLMRQKDISRIPYVDRQSTVEDALLALEEYDSGALLVVGNGKPVGIFSERDFARMALENNGLVPLNQPVSLLMSRKVVYVTPEYRLEECMAIMSSHKFRHLLVLEHEEPLALLSMRHIMEALIEDKAFMVDELTKYITGSLRPDSKELREPLVRHLEAPTEYQRN
jgi:CBS domain-containing protein